MFFFIFSYFNDFYIYYFYNKLFFCICKYYSFILFIQSCSSSDFRFNYIAVLAEFQAA